MTRSGPGPTIRAPFANSCPCSGRRCPPMHMRRVLLPHPLGPISPAYSSEIGSLRLDTGIRDHLAPFRVVVADDLRIGRPRGADHIDPDRSHTLVEAERGDHTCDLAIDRLDNVGRRAEPLTQLRNLRTTPKLVERPDLPRLRHEKKGPGEIPGLRHFG